MKETRISLPEIGLLAATRALAGAGIGLLLADRLSDDQRRAVGWTLFLVGALSTVPLALEIFGGNRLQDTDDPERSHRGNVPEPAHRSQERALARF